MRCKAWARSSVAIAACVNVFMQLLGTLVDLLVLLGGVWWQKKLKSWTIPWLYKGDRFQSLLAMYPNLSHGLVLPAIATQSNQKHSVIPQAAGREGLRAPDMKPRAENDFESARALTTPRASTGWRSGWSSVCRLLPLVVQELEESVVLLLSVRIKVSYLA